MATREALREFQSRLAGRLQAARTSGVSASWLAIEAGDITLLTDDFDLYRASLAAGRQPINFSHERETWLGL